MRCNPIVLKALALGRLPPGTQAKGFPRLRFDRVAKRVVRRLQEVLADVPPEMTALVVTVTAPIRQPGSTVEQLSARLPRPLRRNFDEMVCGNRVRARIVRRGDKGGPRVVVFVHNPQTVPTALFELVEASLSAAQKSTGPASDGCAIGPTDT